MSGEHRFSLLILSLAGMLVCAGIALDRRRLFDWGFWIVAGWWAGRFLALIEGAGRRWLMRRRGRDRWEP